MNNIFKILLFLILVTITSCESEKQDDFNINESSKDITGSWKIISVSRNGEDITKDFDFSQFRIVFSEDKTYAFENYLPFVISKPGTYALDDPQYPYNISFKPTAQNDVTTAFTFPIVDGKRQMQLLFSTGCVNNTYKYVIERTAN